MELVEQVGVGRQQTEGDHQQVVEVEGTAVEQFLLVAPVDGDDLVGIGMGRREAVGLDQVVLGLGDLVQHGAGRELLGVEAEVLQHPFHQLLGVVLVEDGEPVGETRVGGPPPQERTAEGVEGRQGDLVAGAGNQLLHPFAHLAGGLVGEGQRQDRGRGHPFTADQPGDAHGQHAGLARPGPGDDQHRPAGQGHRLALAVVQPGQRFLKGGVHRGCLPSGRGCPARPSPPTGRRCSCTSPAGGSRRGAPGNPRPRSRPPCPPQCPARP